MISIVTINKNNRKGLKKTLMSVSDQEYPEIEYIVIDGQSKDGSYQIIEEFKESITESIIESDHGIYNAMNKGIARAKGEYILFLNSGDWLASKNTIQSFVESKPEAHIVYGDLIFHKDSGEYIRSYPEDIDLLYLTRDTLPHPATFIRRDVFEMLGNYDESLKIVADWALFLKAVLRPKITFARIDVPISHFTADGISSKPESAKLIQEEKKRVMEEILPMSVRKLITEYQHLQREYKMLQSVRLVKLALWITGLKNRIAGRR